MPHDHVDEEHDLPGVEAVIGGVLALMTGYSQSLLAAQNPQHRLLMGTRIGEHLSLLADHPALSANFRRMLGNLQRRWGGMCLCSAGAMLDGAAAEAAAIPTHGAPKRLQ
jgi:hypothetical protein